MIKAVPFFKHAGERFLDDILQVLTQSMYQPDEVVLEVVEDGAYWG